MALVNLLLHAIFSGGPISDRNHTPIVIRGFHTGGYGDSGDAIKMMRQKPLSWVMALIQMGTDESITESLFSLSY